MRRMQWVRAMVVMGLALAALGASARGAQAQSVGAHVGVAFPFVTFVDGETSTIADTTVIAAPLGLGLKLTESLTLDFETVVISTVKPSASTGLIVDPGLVYNWGPLATGLRVAFKIGEAANIGAIPLLNVPLVRGTKATWFAEAAFPIFYQHEQVSLTTALHTGFGF